MAQHQNHCGGLIESLLRCWSEPPINIASPIVKIHFSAACYSRSEATETYREFTRLLSRGDDSSVIVRRYRSGASPLVRDLKGAWRSGRLESVLAGNFDLIGAVAR